MPEGNGRRTSAPVAGRRRRWPGARVRRLALLGGCVLAIAALFAFGGNAQKGLYRLRRKASRHITARLEVRHGMAILVPMDGPHLRNYACPLPVHIRECARTVGRIGDARRIDLDRDAYIRAEMTSALIGPSATYAAWFRPLDCGRKQALFNRRGEASGFALFLENGTLNLNVRWRDNSASASCPYAGVAGAMTHVAASFSPEAVVVYQNGRESLRIDLDKPVFFTNKPIIYGRSVFWPFEGDIDELAVWRRCIDADEIASVARARRGLAWMYEPSLSFCEHACTRLLSFMSMALRAMDRLAPRGGPANMATSVPVLTLWPTKGDERHWARAHSESTRDGFRTRQAASFRSVDMAFGGKVLTAEIALDDIYSADMSPRMAFLLHDSSGTFAQGSGLVRIYPPELYEVLHPDAPYALPLSADFVRLYFGNGFQGIYVVEPFDRVGSLWFAYGERKDAIRKDAIYDSPGAPSDMPSPGADAGGELARVMSLVESDVFFPWSHVETMWRSIDRLREWNQSSHDANDAATGGVASAGEDLPELHLHFAFPVDKFKRTDFSCLFVPPGGGDGKWIIGTGATGGGVRHRGNTSYIKGARRSMSLEFDEPVALMEDGLPARHLILLSGYADPTRLRNRISFDAYRAAAAGRVPNGIAQIEWAKVFVNGEYFGVWEMTHRIRDIFSPDRGMLYKIRATEPMLWFSLLPDMSERIGPADFRAETARPLQELFARTVGARWSGFPAVARELLDIESFLDLHLMLNFTQNQDGQIVNQFLAFDSESGKWFSIPWDYDKTFMNDAPMPMGNNLIAHLEGNYPGFHAAASAKWISLRAGELSDAAMVARIDAYAARLAPLMEVEYRLWPTPGWDGDFMSAVEHLKEIVLARLKVCDNVFR